MPNFFCPVCGLEKAVDLQNVCTVPCSLPGCERVTPVCEAYAAWCQERVVTLACGRCRHERQLQHRLCGTDRP